MKKFLCIALTSISLVSLFGCIKHENYSSSESISISATIETSSSQSISITSFLNGSLPENSIMSDKTSSGNKVSSKSIFSSSLTKSSSVSIPLNQIPAYIQSREASKMSAVKSKITEKFKSIMLPLIGNVNKSEAGICLPEFWSLKDSNKIYSHQDIITGNIVVGECRVNVNAYLDWLEWTIVKQIAGNDKMQVYSMQVKYKNVPVDIYRAVYYNQPFSTCIVLDIRQDAINIEQFQKLASMINIKYDLSANKAGVIDYSNKSAKLIILGNSFIASSEIQSILQEMISANDKNLLIDAESIGYATVDTFVANEEIIDRLQNEGYDFLFLCGFYQNCGASFDKLMSVKASNTNMVIFPAHNESAILPYEQFFKSQTAGIADWKGFIELLLDEGMDKSRLCIDDQHLHSTNMAGYAGACLIYSYLYKSIPKVGTVEAQIATDQLNRYKFDYNESIKYMAEIRQKAYNYLY